MRGLSGIVANSNADFFKMASTKKTRSTVQNRIWRSTNAEGAFETLLGYINATNDNESAFDGESFDGNDFVDFIVLIITKFDHSRSCTF
jgi:hypothetical protein